MLFNSIDFALFLPIVFVIYWFVTQQKIKAQNILLLASSYLFYGWWDWRFLSLIIFSSFIDYFIGLEIHKSNNKKKRKSLLLVSVLVNLGFLGFFKYFNFFSQSFADAFSFFGKEFDSLTLNVILPVGISFYTFQTLSYSIDIYRNKLKPTKDIVAFFAFVSFFPQLVAGPIERATNLLPQFYKKRVFNKIAAQDGFRQILWGLFKKIVIADGSAEIANMMFNETADQSGSNLVLGAIFFAFQIYGDFSGYSDIAIGTARLFGFNLMQNFAFPYFSRDIAEFWRRWHISLSTWFRDYLYIPLGGSRGGTWMKIRNTFIIFIVSGFWHGANWTFIVWGALNALYFLPIMLLNKNRANLDIVAKGKIIPSIKDFINISITFTITILAWVFFRADNITHAFSYLAGIFSKSFFSLPTIFTNSFDRILLVLFLLFFIIIEWFGREEQYALAKLGLSWKRPIRWGFYYSLILIISYFSGSGQTFIYFQF